MEETIQSNTQGFSLQSLKMLTTPEQIIDYCNQTLGSNKIAEKQGRAIYKIESGKVIKVALNSVGLNHNYAEIVMCKTPENANICPRVYDFSNENMWIVAEETAQVTASSFQSLAGMPWNEFVFAIGGAFTRSLSDPSKGEIRQHQLAFDKHYANQFFRRVVNLLKDCNGDPKNVTKLDSWGTTRGLLVIVDFSLTEN